MMKHRKTALNWAEILFFSPKLPPLFLVKSLIYITQELIQNRVTHITNRVPMASKLLLLSSRKDHVENNFQSI
jgi:hypothetical protein